MRLFLCLSAGEHTNILHKHGDGGVSIFPDKGGKALPQQRKLLLLLRAIGNIERRGFAVNDLIRRERKRKRGKGFLALCKGKQLFVCGEADLCALSAEEHTQRRSDQGRMRGIALHRGKIGRLLDEPAQPQKNIAHQRIQLFLGVCREENAVVFQKQKARIARISVNIAIHQLAAVQRKRIAGARGGNKYRLVEQKLHDFFPVLPAAKAVYHCRMHMQHIRLHEKMMEQRFHARALLLFSGQPRIQHVAQDLCFAQSLVFGVFSGPHFCQRRAAHFDKLVLCNGGKRRAGALDIQRIAFFIRSVSAARQDKIRVASVFM